MPLKFRYNAPALLCSRPHVGYVTDPLSTHLNEIMILANIAYSLVVEVSLQHMCCTVFAIASDAAQAFAVAYVGYSSPEFPDPFSCLLQLYLPSHTQSHVQSHVESASEVQQVTV